MTYTSLLLADVRAELEALSRETKATFGGLSEAQLNWRPDATRWSVAQCFDHLVTANGLMFRAADDALTGAQLRTIWQRLPILHQLFGQALIRSQGPEVSRKYVAPAKALPMTSEIGADVIPRFVEQCHEGIERVRRLDDRHAAGIIMTSPFIRFITYSVLDGWRLVVAHDRRHFEQARRVTLAQAFPSSL